MLEQLKGLSERRASAVAAFQKEAQETIKPCLQEFMAAHPGVKAIGWRQYTPYFNDGDPCVFHLHGVYASFSDERDDSFYEEGWEEVYTKVPAGVDPATWEAVCELDKTLNGLEDELEAVFGDHVQVIVTAAGVEVEEHYHN